MRPVCLFYYLSDTKILFTTRSYIIISGTDFISFPTEEKRCGLWWVERSFWIPYQKFQNPPLITECLGIKEGLNSWVAPRFYYHLSLCCRYTTDPLIVTLLHPNHTKSWEELFLLNTLCLFVSIVEVFCIVMQWWLHVHKLLEKQAKLLTPQDAFSEETANLTTSDIQGIKRLRKTEAYHIIQFLKNQASLDFSMSWLFWSSLLLFMISVWYSKILKLMFACLFNAFNYFIKDLFPYLTRTSQLEFLEIASLGYKEE